MKIQLQQFLQRFVSPLNLLLLLSLNLLVAFVILPEANAGILLFSEQPILIDHSFFYTPTEFYAIIEDYSKIGRNLYIFKLLTADLIFVLFYTALASMLAYWLKMKSSIAYFKNACLYPIYFILIAALENGGLVFLLHSFPAKFPLLARLVGLFTATKWILIFGFIGWFIFELMRLGWLKCKKV